MLAKLEPAALAAARSLSKAGLLLLIGFAFATLVDGLSRHLFSQPIDTVGDLGPLVVALSVSCCFPQALLERRNIVIKMTDKLLGKTTNHVLDVAAALLTLIVIALYAWQFRSFAASLARAHEVTVMLRLPVSPFWYVVDANLWLAVVAQAVVTARVLEKSDTTPQRAGAPE
jgi:TRAP-type C4-dicarboxylate transport system permease small subunit